MSPRAIHIEVAHMQDASSFIDALNRFISRRGRLVSIRSDKASRELRKSIHQWNKAQVDKVMLQYEIVWKFNPPSTPHMGRV